jgi:GTP-binding protein HflX
MLKTNVHDHVVYRVKLAELRRLVETLGIEVIGDVVQTRRRPFARFHVGTGKVKEIGRFIRRHDINLVVFYNNLRSSQKLNLIRSLGVDVVDRYEVTLEIFDQMSSDNLSKLQTESARLAKLAPYFKLEASMRFHNDRPFFRSMGEYGFRGQLREITRRQARIKKQIDAIVKENRQRIEKRRRLGFPTICIAGYYNAGKTSLFNALTGDNKLVSDRPFTTLSSKYQRRYIDHETTLMFIDTIGFVIDLDPNLIKRFEINLEDMRSADLVLLLLDLTDPILNLRIKLAEGVRLLRQMEVPRKRIVVIFNKIDAAPEAAQTIAEELSLERLDIPWMTVSAKERTKLDEFLSLIIGRLTELKETPQQPEPDQKVEAVGEG